MSEHGVLLGLLLPMGGKSSSTQLKATRLGEEKKKKKKEEKRRKKKKKEEKENQTREANSEKGPK